MTFRTRLMGISICLALLALMTWGKPLISAFIGSDSPIIGIGKCILLGCVFVVSGLLLARWGLKQLYGAITQTKVQCPTCIGTGHGLSRMICYNAEGQRISNWNDHLVDKRVWTTDCITCDGVGALPTGFFKQGVIGTGLGCVIVVVGLIIWGGWREFTGLPRPVSGTAAENSHSEDGERNGAVPSRLDSPVKSNDPAQPDLQRPSRPATQTSAPAPVPPAAPAEKTPLSAIVLDGRETESSGQVWGIQGSLALVNKQVRGKLKFTLISVGANSYSKHRINSSALIDVVGTFDGTRLQLSGTGVSDSSLIGVGRYELTIDKAHQTFQGTLPNGGGTLKGSAKMTSASGVR